MPQNSYELPSVYSSIGQYQARNQSDQAILSATSSPGPSKTNAPIMIAREDEDDYYLERNSASNMDDDSLVIYRDQAAHDRWLAWLLLGASFSILLFTVVPVVADIPYIVPSWFSGDTLWRLFDPLFTLPLNLFVMTRATTIMTGGQSNYWGILSEQSVAWLFWCLGAGIFVQGHGVHTAAAMFKHPVQDFNLAHPELVTQYPILQQIYSNMRDLWEHIIAHYMYAFGGMVMSWAHLFAFRNQVHGPLTIGTKIVFAVGSLVYGLLLAGIAIEFPDGLYVGLVYSIVIGLVCVSIMLIKPNGLRKGGILTMGRRMVPQFYLGSCVVGLIIVIIWIGIYGFKNRLDAGVAT